MGRLPFQQSVVPCLVTFGAPLAKTQL